jgi:hypothetical protein
LQIGITKREQECPTRINTLKMHRSIKIITLCELEFQEINIKLRRQWIHNFTLQTDSTLLLDDGPNQIKSEKFNGMFQLNNTGLCISLYASPNYEKEVAFLTIWMPISTKEAQS